MSRPAEEIDDLGENADDLRMETGLELLACVALRNLVVFPSQVVPLTVGRDVSLQAVEASQRRGTALVVVAQRDEEESAPKAEDLYTVGCKVEILKVLRMPDGTQTVVIQGTDRFVIEDVVQVAPFIEVTGRCGREVEVPSVHLEALATTVVQNYQAYSDLAPYLSNEHVVMVHNAENAGRLADMVAGTLQLEMEEKQELLETEDAEVRLERIARALTKELQVQELSNQIQTEIQGELSKNQKDYFLREQIKAIKRELGDAADPDDELDELRLQVEEAELPEDALKAAEKELKRLGRMNPSSPEYGVSRTYLECLLDIPWNQVTQDDLDINRAEFILNRDHHDLEKVKKRILEFLAVRKLKADMKGPILCFLGPPGVGKTSLGRSIAEALGRKFVRLSLGGLRDDAEIRGHRRTYVGAMPGRIVQSLRKVASSNPVIMLDEIDKLGSSFQGDPASALLEVLDPEQNVNFSDHYVEVPVDLSNVLFIATANWGDPIPAPLRDRMEMIRIPGYANHDKLAIAQRYLVPRQIEAHGLKKSQLSFQKKALTTCISDYTREAGVRELERKIAAMTRAVAREFVEGRTEKRSVKAADVEALLGPKRYYSEVADRTKTPGVATGLAWTPVGGEILFIEATSMRGKGRLTLTGHLGNVMKESAQAALSYLRSQQEALGLSDNFFDSQDIHIHIPAGATPKDGPSAGVSLTTALVSLFTGRAVKNKLAMTGEITLRGRVLAVGGVKEKVLAAKRAGITTVILPARNEVDVEEIPELARQGLKFHYVQNVSEVLELALQKSATKKK